MAERVGVAVKSPPPAHRQADPGTAPVPRGRPRATLVTDRLVMATLRLVAGRGYHGFTIDDLASECATSKQAIYRRWPSKPALVADAIALALAGINAEPPPGDFYTSLTTALTNLTSLLMTTAFGRAVTALIGIYDVPELVDALTRVEAERRQLLIAIMMRGQAEGVVSPDRDIDLDVDTLLGAIYFRFSFRQRPVDRHFVDQLVRQWRAGVQQ